MGLDDKAKAKAQESKGKGEEVAGGVTGDRSQQAEGQKNKAAGSLKQALEKVKDAFK